MSEFFIKDAGGNITDAGTNKHTALCVYQNGKWVEWTGGDPLAHYKVRNVETAGSITYYGFIDTAGHWYILQQTTTGSALLYQYCFSNNTATGATVSFTTAWAGKAGLTYSDYVLPVIY
jgi:hypothetical protein